MVPILINNDVFESSYDDLKFMVQNRNYVCINIILAASFHLVLPFYSLYVGQTLANFKE